MPDFIILYLYQSFPLEDGEKVLFLLLIYNLFNALEIQLDTFHCLKIRNKTKQIPYKKKPASKEATGKILQMYWTHYTDYNPPER